LARFHTKFSELLFLALLFVSDESTDQSSLSVYQGERNPAVIQPKNGGSNLADSINTQTLQMKHTERTKLYRCEHCGIGNMWYSDLKRHLKKHSDVRKYVCRVCCVAFKERRHLRAHQRYKHSEATHLFEQTLCQEQLKAKCSQFRCPACAKIFSALSNFRRHIMCMQQVKGSWKCTVCGHLLASKCALKAHTKNAHWKNGKVCCNFCTLDFVNLQVLKRHIERKHTDVYSGQA